MSIENSRPEPEKVDVQSSEALTSDTENLVKETDANVFESVPATPAAKKIDKDKIESIVKIIGVI